MKRLFDIVFSITCIFIFFPAIVIVALLVKATSTGPTLYWSDRVGRNNEIFRMPKFRSMKVGAPTIATHLLNNAQSYITPIGAFLRKSSLDELPQLWCIFCGDMSVVGPRPALYNQIDLIELRTKFGVHKLKPGLTGLAQISGRDELPIPSKVQFDFEYMRNSSFFFDLGIIWKTVLKVLLHEGVSH